MQKDLHAAGASIVLQSYLLVAAGLSFSREQPWTGDDGVVVGDSAGFFWGSNS